jgi:hypothetical protein
MMKKILINALTSSDRDHLASNDVVSDVDYIEKLPSAVIREAAELLNRLPNYVYDHWIRTVKPILLSYHNGTLHMDFKQQFLKYVVEMKVGTILDVDWNDVVRCIPGQSATSLVKFLPYKFGNKYPLYKFVEDYLATVKNKNKKNSSAAYRERLVYLYDKARGILGEEN